MRTFTYPSGAASETWSLTIFLRAGRLQQKPHSRFPPLARCREEDVFSICCCFCPP
jgi:hypothetical protein